MLDFRPPKDSPALIRLVKSMMPAICRFHLRNARIEILGDGLERFKTLRGKRTIICPNHPNFNDPEIMLAFSKLAGEDFNFLAARETFDLDAGLRGWLFQHMGCYSVVRGAVDRESFKTTKSLIVSGKKKLVIFPEGEVSSQNDTLMPLETGVGQMGFWALDELRKSNSDEPVFILPVALKYTYRCDIKEKLATSLAKLEAQVNIKGDTKATPYERLRAIAGKLLSALEKEYGFNAGQDATFNDRIVGLRAFILKNMADFLKVDLPPGDSQLDWIRILRNTLDNFIYEESEQFSAYEKKIRDEKAGKIRGFYRDLDRVINFIAIYDGYLKEHMTQERFADVVARFEREIFEAIYSIKGPRQVSIDVGRPINLAEYYADYKSSKRVTVVSVVDEISRQISTMLDALERKRSLVFVD